MSENNEIDGKNYESFMKLFVNSRPWPYIAVVMNLVPAK